MESPQNEFDRAFEEKLRKRFDDFQAPEKDELFDKIIQSAGTSRPPVNLTTLSVILLLILGLWAGYHFLGPAPDKANFIGKKEATKPALNQTVRRAVTISNAKSPLKMQQISQSERSRRPGNHNRSAVNQSLTKVSMPVHSRRSDNQNIGVENQPFKAAALHTPTKRGEGVIVDSGYKEIRKIAIDETELKLQPSFVKTEQAFAPSPTRPSSIIFTTANMHLLATPLPHFGNYPLPEVTIPGSSKAHKAKYKPKISKFSPVLSVTGLQQFQFINLHSDSELPFQNVRFAPLFSSRSTGYKISMGMENQRLRVLFNYGQLRSWNYYEIGNNQIEVSPTDNGQYVLRRGGIPHLIDERLHLLGISARTPLPLSRTWLRGFATLVGAEYTMVLPDRSSIFWANISSTKSFNLGKKLDLAIGPFAELSLTQRKLLEGRWQSRPYRIGLTAELKMPGSN